MNAGNDLKTRTGIIAAILYPGTLLKNGLCCLWKKLPNLRSKKQAPIKEEITREDFEQVLKAIQKEVKENADPAWYQKWEDGWQPVLTFAWRDVILPIGLFSANAYLQERAQNRQLNVQRESMAMQAAGLGMQNDALTMQRSALGMQGEALGMQRDALGMQGRSLILQKLGLNMQGVGLIMQGKSLGMQAHGLATQDKSYALGLLTFKHQRLASITSYYNKVWKQWSDYNAIAILDDFGGS